MKAVSWCQADGKTRMSMGFSMHASDRLRARLSRRQFVRAATGLGLSVAGAPLLAACSRLGSSLPSAPAVGEPRPETTTLRLIGSGTSFCQAPKLVAEDLLRGEGFTDVQFLPQVSGSSPLAAGEIDINADFAPMLIRLVDAGAPITILGGLHVGCFELFGAGQVRAVRDLKGRTVAVRGIETPPHVFLSSMLAYVGLNPATDVTWTVRSSAEAIQLLANGQIDAYMGFPPEPQEIRAASIGQVVVNSANDRPWSQYFCCMLAGNREFVLKHPVAARRATRAILKATDLCAAQPELAAQKLVDTGLTKRYDLALQTMQDVHYSRWREYDAEDTVRFYALRLQEIGMIKSTPDQVIKSGTNWQFFNELKRELKA